MWHEARRQERLIRGMMVDYKKRAERRREYYEKIKLDPTQFLRIHARASKIHLDPAVAAAAESPLTMMPWQGDSSQMIDRFDVRAHLDHIPQRPPSLPTLDEIREEQKCNYERYRTLVHNDHAEISEEQCLHQIHVEEMFPDIQKRPGDEKEKLSAMRAAIGFTYDVSENSSLSVDGKSATKDEEEEEEDIDSDSDSDVSFSEIDLDVVIDVEELTKESKTQLNVVGEKYGMAPEAFIKMLNKEKIEADDMRQAKEDEEEKAMFSGRKSRRERRAIIERKLRERKTAGNSPPSYAARGSPTYDPYPGRSLSRSSSSSRGNSPEQPGKVTFITSFGGDEDNDDSSNSKANKDKKSTSAPSSSSSSSKNRPGSSSSSLTRSTDSHSKSWHKDSRRSSTRSRSHSRSRSRSRDRGSSYRYHDHRHRGRSPSDSNVSSSRYRRGSRSRSDSRSRSRSRDRNRRSRSSSRDRRHSYSSYQQRSRSRSTSHNRHQPYRRRSRSRSRSRSKSPPPQRYGMMSTLNSLRQESEEKSIAKAKAKAATTPNKPKLTQREKLKLKMQKF